MSRMELHTDGIVIIHLETSLFNGMTELRQVQFYEPLTLIPSFSAQIKRG